MTPVMALCQKLSKLESLLYILSCGFTAVSLLPDGEIFMKKLMLVCALVTLLLAVVMIAPLHRARLQTPQSSVAPKAQVDRRSLEDIEDRSEDIANGLLELSVAVRDDNPQKIAGYFAESAMTTPLPAAPTAQTPEVKWVQKHGWKFEPKKTVATTRAEIARQWEAFLANFAEIEDVRFKLRASNFEENGNLAKATVTFYLIGRNHKGQREWMRATTDSVFAFSANSTASGGMQHNLSQYPGKWFIRDFTINAMNSLVSTTDIFNEVGEPAGVGAVIPAYGEAGNTGFVWHGAAAADFNNDGNIDLFVTASDRNFLYLNDGQGHFRDASETAGVKQLESGAGVIAFDYDNDGDTDLFIANVGQQILLENRLVPDGKLAYRDVSLEAGVAVQAFGFSAAVADVNGDGKPDIYVASYNKYGQVVPDSWFRATNGTPNLLFINQGNGTFKEEAKKWGVDDSRWSYAAAFADVNGDHKPDLYLANDFGEKALYINKGDHFTDEAKERGVLDPGNGMGVAFGDYNNDGLLDIHATNMSSTAGNRILARLFPNQGAKDNVYKKLASGNNLFENLGDGHYKDVTAEVGGFSGGWAWGGGFIDFDGDGWEDLYAPNGFISGKSMKDT